jgi:hypothetical protein
MDLTSEYLIPSLPYPLDTNTNYSNQIQKVNGYMTDFPTPTVSVRTVFMLQQEYGRWEVGVYRSLVWID